MNTSNKSTSLQQESRPIALVDDCRAQIDDTDIVTFGALAASFAKPELGKKDGYALIPADIDTGARKADRVRSISFLFLDVEAHAEADKDDKGQSLLDQYGDIIKRVTGLEPPSVDGMVAELSSQDVRSCLHTTYAHSTEHPRYRLIFDLTRPLTPVELKPLGIYVAGLLGLSDCFDAACLDPARLFFNPRCPSQERMKLFRHEVLEGEPLDVDALMAEAVKIDAALKSAEAGRKTRESPSVIDAFNAQADIGLILAEHGYLAKGRNRWLWPGSTTGMPGARLLSDDGRTERVYSNHGGDPLNDGFAHDAFDCWRILKHAGDMTAAVREAARLLGLNGAKSGRNGAGRGKHHHGEESEPGGNSGNPEPFIKATQPTPWPDDCLPPGMAEAVKAIAEHVQAPVALAGMAVLGAVSHIAMRLVDAQHPKKGAMPASLFILTALESGGRKSECFSTATDPITKQERVIREAYKARLKDYVNSTLDAPSDPRAIFTNTTIQKIEQVFVNGSAPALSLSTDEGGALLGGHSLKSETRPASLGTLTRLFDGAGVQRDRVGEGQSGFRYGVRFGLFLSAQPIVLADALADPMLRGQGFLPRFLYAAPASLAGMRLHDENTLSRKAAEDVRIIAYWNTLKRMCERTANVDAHGGLVLPMVALDDDAVAAWLALYNETEVQQGIDGDYELLGAFASRAGELAARVAAVFAAWSCCENDREMSEAIVTGDDMNSAVALVRFSLSEWHRQASGSALSIAERDAYDLLEFLHRKGWETTTRVQIGQHCRNALRKDTKRRNAAVAELLRRGWLIETAAGGFAVIQKK